MMMCVCAGWNEKRENDGAGQRGKVALLHFLQFIFGVVAVVVKKKKNKKQKSNELLIFWCTSIRHAIIVPCTVIIIFWSTNE